MKNFFQSLDFLIKSEKKKKKKKGGTALHPPLPLHSQSIR